MTDTSLDPGKAIAAQCRRHGLDLSAHLRAGAYNRHVARAHRLPDFGDAGSEVVLIGNTRALWPAFLEAFHGDPQLRCTTDPVDRYTERVLAKACAVTQTPTRVRFAHRPEPAHIAFQTLAEVAGLAWRSPASLSVHPVYGPWIALRAAVVLDRPGPDTTGPMAAACQDCTQGCAAQFERAMANEAATWQDWLAVRDSCPTGREHRYSDRQIGYHYTKSRGLLEGDTGR